MGRGVGRSISGDLSLSRVDRPRSSRPDGRRRGDTYYPTVLEAYSQRSDFSRWQRGQALYQDVGSGWSNLESKLLLRNLVNDGSVRTWQPLTIIRFPGSTSPEGAWTACWSHRGAILLPGELTAARITLDRTSPRTSEHRLILDVSSQLSANQLRAFKAHIGRQFENGATSGQYPNGLVQADAPMTYAFTLMEVDENTGQLLFDLSRPYLRRPVSNRLYWTKLDYRPQAPLSWSGAEGRYLCSSDTFYCNCPDHSGQNVTSLQAQGSSSKLFPRPAAGQSDTTGESLDQLRQQVGYINRWRTLPNRVDQRRECKHVHAARWISGAPFAEPSDYGAASKTQSGIARGASQGVIERFLAVRDLTLDQYIPALSVVSSLELDPASAPPEGTTIARNDGSRILWTSQRPPEAASAQPGDWWLKRGSQLLEIFDGDAGLFRAQTPEGGELIDVLRQDDSHRSASVPLAP